MTQHRDEAAVDIAVSEAAIRCLQNRSELNRTIYAAMRDYRMSNMADEDGYPYPLIDLMSNPAPSDIGTGEMEMVALVDEIEAAIEAQLAGATRRAENLEAAIAIQNKQAVQQNERAEQAERMLAEAVELLEGPTQESFQIGPQEFDTLGFMSARLDWDERKAAFLTTIRSAASGEQG